MAKRGLCILLALAAVFALWVPAFADGPAQKPSTPKLTTAEVTTAGVRIAWKASSNAEKYLVYCRTVGDWYLIAETGSTSYTWTDAWEGVRYMFTVLACNGAGCSEYDSSGVMSVTYCAAPTVKAAASVDGIKLTWNKTAGSPRYTVYYRENGGAWHRIGTTAKTSYTRAASKLKSGVTYQFTVRCCAADKKTLLSGYRASSEVKFTAGLAAPKVKIAQAKNGIKATWNKVDGTSRYTVYYRENGGAWHRIGTTAKTSYTRAASKLKDGAAYQFTVRCCAADKKTLLSSYRASNNLRYTK